MKLNGFAIHCIMSFIGHENNVHCLAIAVNAIAGAVFAFYGEQEQKDKMLEFIVVSTCNYVITYMYLPILCQI